jgi:hypothetical protein
LKPLFIVFSFLFVFGATSQVVLQPVKWFFNYQKINDSIGTVVISAHIDKDWHIYSIHQNGDGPIATSISFNEEDDFKLIGNTEEPEPKTLFSEVFAMEVKSFSDSSDFNQQIQLNSLQIQQITGKLEFMACTEFSCLPPKTIDFVIKIKK